MEEKRGCKKKVAKNIFYEGDTEIFFLKNTCLLLKGFFLNMFYILFLKKRVRCNYVQKKREKEREKIIAACNELQKVHEDE